MERVYIGLGSNLADPVSQLRGALAALGELPGTRLAAVSSLYASDPLGPPDQPRYVNAVAALDTDLAPLELIGVAGVAGVVRLRGLLEAYTSSRTVARSTLAAWITGNALLGMQFSWILRPFFGTPKLEVAFLRPNPMRGSFAEAVWASLKRILGGMGFESWMLAVVCACIAAIVILQIRNENRKTRQ